MHWLIKLSIDLCLIATNGYIIFTIPQGHIMLDKALETITNSDAFYFQLYPLSLYIANPHCDLPASGTTYRLTLLKGTHPSTQDSKSSTKPNSPSRLLSDKSMVVM
jgi:hypothetical protein